MSDPRIPTMKTEEADPSLRPVFDRYIKERGNVPNMFRTMALRPEIAKTADAHMAAVLAGGTVPRQLKELCVVRVSHLNSCAY
ncbi:MAG: carboxymuconolactone decarboxylase family protein [Chloroflexia bacterium]